ncbi:MerR family transcriptional regulator [Bowmanella dokdonensis]|uniref:MerR family transcriptional regulator n=1 Tax=Bowmanella dokdonensis TaxID=751969 RepID=A0A939DNX1_9ALTE|nr:MerR family transcriptional regulator [Bowmanella dokdonensis]MBN7826248.1 MerR family transcriptional regulator [Bowmanella dokdonensis]
MKINQLATASGIPAKTIRYYEQIGLLEPAERAQNGYRLYSQQDVDCLVFIRRCRDLQIPLEEVGRLLQVQRQPTDSCDEVENIIKRQLQRVQQTREELSKLEASLTALANCCDNNQVSKCGILSQLKP